MALVGRWYIPGREPRYLRRNALIVLGKPGDPSDPAVEVALTPRPADDRIRSSAPTPSGPPRGSAAADLLRGMGRRRRSRWCRLSWPAWSRTVRSGVCRLAVVTRHLLVTNDFPPKIGGIQSYLWELWRRLPPDDVTVLTTPHERRDRLRSGSAVPGGTDREPVLLPTPVLTRRIRRLAAEVGAKAVVIDPAFPSG